ncbi:MAG TPA: DUF3011 domain-containing protein [Rhodanobacter sp.]
MRTVLKIWLAVGVLLVGAGFASRGALAQGYGDRGQGQEVYCASNDTRGTRCQMPWRDSVLAQQMSKASCVEGRTWGSDPYSVWVKGGCRGNFRNARAWGGPGPGGGQGGQEVYCASNDNRGTRCRMPWRYSALSRQMSDAACIEGRTWGSDPYSVWVKGGCRAQFRDARAGRPRW